MKGARARSALAGTRFADVRWVAGTGSTNADALALARSGAPDGVVVVADHQRAGRGRLDRSWEAGRGEALLVSVLVRPEAGGAEPHQLVGALAVAAAEACEAEVPSGPPVGLKWPNDLVVVDGDAAGKLGGILAESLVEGGEVGAVVVGLGLNLAWPLSVEPEVAATATSLARMGGATGGRGADAEEVLVAVLRGFERWSDALATPAGRGGLAAEQRRRSATLGQQVRVEAPGGSFEGEAVELTVHGHLVVDVGGSRREVAAGDVVRVRPS